MDGVDCCGRHSLPDHPDEAGITSPGGEEAQGSGTIKRHTGEDHRRPGTAQESHQCLASLYPVEDECLGHGLPSGYAVDAKESMIVPQGIGNGDDGWPPSKPMEKRRKDGAGILPLVSGQHVGPEESWNENGPCFNTKNGPQASSGTHPNCPVHDTVNYPGHETRLQENGNHDNAPLRGTDETDQGQVVPTLNLTGNQPMYSIGLATSGQHYRMPEEDFSRPAGLIANTTVTESPGSTSENSPEANSNTCNFRILRGQGHQTMASSCAISKTTTTALQGQTQSACNTNGEQAPASRPCMDSEELAKRKVEDLEAEDQSSKRQKGSPIGQPDMQYNQNIVSMPRKYTVSGTGNYLFDSPTNCTFHLHQSQSNDPSQKQHAMEWAGLSSQTDSGNDTMPAPALETVAKLITQTTNWKTFARRLPLCEGHNLETDIRTLEGCQGTTSDKTLAVLMRWWKEQPGQSDGVEMKARLRDGLEACGLIRLARSLDKYL